MPEGLPQIATILVNENVLVESAAREIVGKAAQDKIGFMEALGKNSKQVSRKAAESIARVFGVPFIDIEAIDLDAIPEKLIDRKRVAEERALPIFVRGKRMFVAVSDPSDHKRIEAVGFAQDKRVDILVADECQLAAAIAKLAGDGGEIPEMGDEVNGLETVDDEPQQPETSVESLAEDAPVVKLVNAILLQAIKRGASDIHFEPYEKMYRVRMRIDGILEEAFKPPLNYKDAIASRIKVVSKLNIAERRVPQDGRMRLNIPGGRQIDFRVSTCPMLHGEKIVMRILDPSSAKLGIDALGYEPDQKKLLMDAINRPYGMVLVTGPTGSGKTVSLYTCLNILNEDPTRNISTAEDPAEINLPGINQVNVNPDQGLTFAAALKSFLRQDPDIIMVGEIRDEETAMISVKAAQTGHLVLSTLHTNDAPKTVSRLMEIGVKPFNITSSVILITAQRLGRRLCPKCKVEDKMSEQQLIELGMRPEHAKGLGKDWTLFKPNTDGCDSCNRGYKGRVGFYEVMPMSEAIQQIILRNGTSIEIAAQAQADGVNTMRQSGFLKVRSGLTSVSEVVDCTNE